MTRTGDSKLPNAIKEIVCQTINKGNDIHDWGVEAHGKKCRLGGGITTATALSFTSVYTR